MMGERAVAQEAVFYSFSLERHVPASHMLRAIDRFVDLSSIREHLKPFYSETGRPSIDPELMIRMLMVGYCMGIRSERRLCDEVHLNLACLSLVLPAGARWRRARPLDLLEEPPWSFPRQRPVAPPVRDDGRALHG